MTLADFHGVQREEAWCPCCERPMPKRAERNGLEVVSDPWRVRLRGGELGGFTPMTKRFLFMLLRFGEVSSGALEMLLSEETESPKAVHVHISRLRSTLRAAAVPVEIQSIRAWGYRLNWRLA